MFDLLELCPALFQSVANLTPSGESLKILARDLGTRVYTKYSIRQKHRNQILEKLNTIYNAYTGVLAKDTQVNEIVQIRLLVSFWLCFSPLLRLPSVRSVKSFPGRSGANLSRSRVLDPRCREESPNGRT